SSACFSTKAICASENFDLFIARSASLALLHNWNFPAPSGPENRQQVTMNPTPPSVRSYQTDQTGGGARLVLGTRALPCSVLNGSTAV
ncbi:hypothetical protein, partial [Sphingomonas sp. SAFR-052]|uniref:hypothetical protein n=1 Tax=Sphingomonas sp. SAFR-052 TaxID=3436867 RepID=UPI003F7D5107